MKQKCLLISLVILLLSTQSLFASLFEQKRADYSVAKMPITKAIEKLFAGSDYSVVFAARDIDKSQLITLTLKDCTVETILKEILDGTGLSYYISDKQVVISKPAKQERKNQKRIITGKIIDKDTQEPVIAASIFVPGTTTGTQSDLDGKFTLDVKGATQLKISCIGYKTIIRTITQKSDDIIIYLESDMMALGEVVVNGYKTTTISRVTGSVGVIKSEELKDSPLKSMDMLLQGKLSGVSVQAVSGRPGETAKIRIRGTNTITGNAEPLWVVDGVMLQKDLPSISTGQIKAGDFNSLFSNGIAGINPNDIENITVLKDASAAAIYGSRAAGGVIVVTTKRGREGKLSVSYSGGISVITKPIRTVDLMSSQEKIAWERELWDEFAQDGYTKGEHYPVVGIVGMVRSGYGKYGAMSSAERENYLDELSKNTTNWFDEIFRSSISHNHYLSLSGGSKKTNYYISLGYSTNNGLLKNNVYDRYNLSSKIDFNVNDKIRLDFNTSLAYQFSKGASGSTNLFSYAYFANPYEKPYNEDGSYKADETYFALRSANGDNSYTFPNNGINVFRELNETSNKTTSFDMTQTVSLSWKIIDKLRFEGMGSLSYSNNNADNINGKNTYAAFSDRPFEGQQYTSQRTYGSISQSSAYNTSYNLRGQLSYNKQITDKHYISAIAGSEIRKSYAKSIYEKRYGYDPVSGNSSFPIYPGGGEDGLIPYDYLVSYASIMDGLSGQSISEAAVASFYFSTDYSYDERYTLSFTTRTDGSNNFGSKQQFNPIWSLGGTWNVSNEKFLKGKSDVISHLSVRAATGYTGNINKSVYPQFIMDYSTSFRKRFDDFYRMGYINSAPNPNLRWERTFDYKFGVDMGMFKNRLHFNVEYYYRLSSDVVTKVSVPETTGFSSQSYNTSKIENRGIEISLGGTILKKNEFSLSASANFSYNRNILKDYYSPTGSTYGALSVGYPLNSLFTGICEGIDKYTGVYIFKARSDAKFETKNDYEDGDNYLFYVGTNNAPYTGGFSLSCRYRNFNLSMGGSYSIGAKILNEISSPASYSGIQKQSSSSVRVPTSHNDLYRNHLNVLKSCRYRWTEENQITDGMPRLIDPFAADKGYETYMTTSSLINNAALMESVSYLKIRSVMLSYSFGPEVLRRLKISSLGVNFTINNILTLSDYSGFDPETPGAVYPQSRSFSFGLNLGF